MINFEDLKALFSEETDLIDLMQFLEDYDSFDDFEASLPTDIKESSWWKENKAIAYDYYLLKSKFEES